MDKAQASNKTENSSGRKYPIPQTLIIHFPVETNKFGSDPQTEHWIEWVQQFCSMTKESFAKITAIVSGLANCYPFCNDINRYEVNLKHILLLTICDDKIDMHLDNYNDSCNGFAQIIGKLEDQSSHSIFSWNTDIIGLYLTTKHIYDSYNEVQKQRMIAIYKEYQQGLSLEKDKSIEFNNLNEYMELRIMSAGFGPMIQQIEYTDELFVPEDVWNSTPWQRLYKLVNMYGIYLTDIYSFEREVRQLKSKDKMLNSVSLLCDLKGITVSKSMEEIVEIILILEKEIIAINNKLLGDDQFSPEAKKFIEGMNYLMSGLVEMYKTSNRYN